MKKTKRSNFYLAGIVAVLGGFFFLKANVVHAKEKVSAFHTKRVIFVINRDKETKTNWPQLESRITEELNLLSLHVELVRASVQSDREIDPALSAAAMASRDASLAFYLQRVSDLEFELHLFLVTGNREVQSENKQLTIQIEPETQQNELVEIVALKTVEAVHAALSMEGRSIENDKTEPSIQTPESQPSISIETRDVESASRNRIKGAAIAVLVTGGAVFGLGGWIHSRKLYYEREAIDMEGDYRSAPAYYSSMDKFKEITVQYRKNDKIFTAYLIGTRVLYTVAGALAAAGIVLVAIGSSRERKRVKRLVKVTPTVNGMTLEF